MSDLTTKHAQGTEDHSAKAQQDAQKARLEDEKRKNLTVNVEPAKAAAQAASSHHATHDSSNKISASHNEAARTHDAGRAFEKFAQTKPTSNPPPSLEAQKAANQQDALKIAELQRQRNPNVKA